MPHQPSDGLRLEFLLVLRQCQPVKLRRPLSHIAALQMVAEQVPKFVKDRPELGRVVHTAFRLDRVCRTPVCRDSGSAILLFEESHFPVRLLQNPHIFPQQGALRTGPE